MEHRQVYFMDVANQWLMSGFMGAVVALLYLVLFPQLDRIEKTIIQSGDDTHTHISVELSEETRAALQQLTSEQIPWKNLEPELQKHTNPPKPSH